MPSNLTFSVMKLILKRWGKNSRKSTILHLSMILILDFGSVVFFVFHFIVAFLIISPYLANKLLRDYNYDNNIMLITSTELLVEVIIVIRVIKVSVTNLFSIFFSKIKSLLKAIHLLMKKNQNKTKQKYQYLFQASLILEVCYINSFKRHFSTIQWIRLFNECYMNIESYFISVTKFRLVCLFPIVAYAYVLSFFKHNFCKMKLVFITIDIWSSCCMKYILFQKNNKRNDFRLFVILFFLFFGFTSFFLQLI